MFDEIFISLYFIYCYNCGVMSKMSPHERSILRRVTVGIGSVIDVNGVLLKCIERSHVSCVSEACSGCYFSQENKTCPPSQCSSWGRHDGKNVWFVRYEDIENR